MRARELGTSYLVDERQPNIDEFRAMSFEDVETHAESRPRWPRRNFSDWLWERGRDWGPDESFGDFWRHLEKRMRRKGARRVGDLGDEVTEEWHPRLAAHYRERQRLGLGTENQPDAP